MTVNRYLVVRTADIAVGIMLVCAAAVTIVSAALRFDAGASLYLAVLGVAAATTPVWAVPLLRRRLRQAAAAAEAECARDSRPPMPVRRRFFADAIDVFDCADANRAEVAVLKIVLDGAGAAHADQEATLAAVTETVSRVAAGFPGIADSIVARLDGDELVLVAAGLDRDESERLAERIVARVRATNFAPDGRLVSPLVRIGVAQRKGRDDPGTALRYADQALREAQASGHPWSVLTGAGVRSLEGGVKLPGPERDQIAHALAPVEAAARVERAAALLREAADAA